VLEVNLVGSFLLARVFGVLMLEQVCSAGTMRLIPALFTSTSTQHHFALDSLSKPTLCSVRAAS
jgi:hypothetical protein